MLYILIATISVVINGMSAKIVFMSSLCLLRRISDPFSHGYPNATRARQVYIFKLTEYTVNLSYLKCLQLPRRGVSFVGPSMQIPDWTRRYGTPLYVVSLN